MAAIRSLQEIANKWKTVTPQRSNEYRAGIEAPRKDWAEATAAASDNWANGVQEAAASGAFGRGVSAAGTDKWRRGALLKGVSRWGPGVQIAENDYAKGFGPYRDAISNLTLPARFARRDPRNLERVRAVVDAMIATKKSVG